MRSSALTAGQSSSYTLCASASRAAVRDGRVLAGMLELLRSAPGTVLQPAEAEQGCLEHTHCAAGQGSTTGRPASCPRR